jgi:hypothetical protein
MVATCNSGFYDSCIICIYNYAHSIDADCGLNLRDILGSADPAITIFSVSVTRVANPNSPVALLDRPPAQKTSL